MLKDENYDTMLPCRIKRCVSKIMENHYNMQLETTAIALCHNKFHK